MKNRLIITGNGFDLYHGLKTSYADFRKYLDENSKITLSSGRRFNLSTLAERYLDQKDRRGEFILWKDFESGLGEIDALRLISDLEDHHLDREDLDELMGALCAQFPRWLNTIMFEGIQTKDQFQFCKQDRFLSFNYTLTLENLYQINPSQITHLHGTVNDGKNIIFGHGKEWNETKTPLDDYFRKFVPYVIYSHGSFFDSLKEVSQVFVLGHSFSDVDLPYFKEILCCSGEKIPWIVSYGEDCEKELFAEKLLYTGIRNWELKNMNKIFF